MACFDDDSRGARSFTLLGVVTCFYMSIFGAVFQERPYHVDRTTSRPLCEVKRRRAGVVLRWGTTWEVPVLFLLLLQPPLSLLLLQASIYLSTMRGEPRGKSTLGVVSFVLDKH